MALQETGFVNQGTTFAFHKDPRGEALALSTLSELYRSQQRYQEGLHIIRRIQVTLSYTLWRPDDPLRTLHMGCVERLVQQEPPRTL